MICCDRFFIFLSLAAIAQNQPFQKNALSPCLAPSPLPPLSKGGGLTALQNRYSISSSFCNLPDCFQNCYTFCRQDGGDCVCLEDLKIVLLLISIPTVTARNSFRIVKAGLSEYCTASQKIISAVPPPLFRGEARYGAWLRQYRYQNDSDKA